MNSFGGIVMLCTVACFVGCKNKQQFYSNANLKCTANVRSEILQNDFIHNTTRGYIDFYFHEEGYVGKHMVITFNDKVILNEVFVVDSIFHDSIDIAFFNKYGDMFGGNPLHLPKKFQAEVHKEKLNRLTVYLPAEERCMGFLVPQKTTFIGVYYYPENKETHRPDTYYFSLE